MFAGLLPVFLPERSGCLEVDARAKCPLTPLHPCAPISIPSQIRVGGAQPMLHPPCCVPGGLSLSNPFCPAASSTVRLHCTPLRCATQWSEALYPAHARPPSSISRQPPQTAPPRIACEGTRKQRRGGCPLTRWKRAAQHLCCAAGGRAGGRGSARRKRVGWRCAHSLPFVRLSKGWLSLFRGGPLWRR